MNPLPAQTQQANLLRRILFSLATIFFAWPSLSSAQSGFVRVHQAGYVSNAPKRAYLMTTASSTGSSFTVNGPNGVALSAAIGADQGKWGTFTHVYALDFDSVTTAGTYTISITGTIAATSPSFRIDSGASLYATPLANSLFFYENERDGANFISSPLRNAAGHLNDAARQSLFLADVQQERQRRDPHSHRRGD